MYWPGCIERRIDRKSTRLNSSHTEIYTLSLHDALPIFEHPRHVTQLCQAAFDHFGLRAPGVDVLAGMHREADRSEEHTSELQSHRDLHSFPTRRSSDLRTPSPRNATLSGCVRPLRASGSRG